MSIPGAASPLFLAATAAGPAGGFEISRSLRFNSGDSAYLSRVVSSASNQNTWTWSGWIKKHGVGTQSFIFGAAGYMQIYFSTDQILVDETPSGGSYWTMRSTAVLRDPAAWYHCVFVYDSTQSTASNRFKVYVNNSEITSWVSDTRSNIVQNNGGRINSAAEHRICRPPSGSGASASAYANVSLAEVNFIDGTALDPSSFGETDANGVWQAIDTAGLTFGTNGFRLKFADNSSNAALGTDSSGKSNTWTVNNLNASEGVWNQTQTWSSNITTTGNGGSWYSTLPATRIFDANITNYGHANGDGSVTCVVTLSFSPTVTCTSSVIFYGGLTGSGTGTISVNGGTAVNLTAGSSSTTATTVSFAGAISSIVITKTSNDGAGLLVYGFKVDNIRLIDSGIANTEAKNIDCLVDSPTNGTQTDTGVGGQVVANYATFNPLSTNITGSASLSNGNLSLDATSATYINARSTIAASSLNCYCEMTVTTRSNTSGLIGIGVGDGLANIAAGTGAYTVYRAHGGVIQYPGNVTAATVATYTVGDVIGMAISPTEVAFYKNSALQGTYSHNLTGDYFVTGMAYNNGGTAFLDFNFGQRPFVHAAPTNFKALNTASLPTPTIADGSLYFDTKLWTGNATARNITTSMSPDMVWIKKRNSAQFGNHTLFDVVRGATKALVPNDTQGEGTETGQLTAFNSDGFSLGTSTLVNGTSNTYVSWAWDGGNGNKTYAITVANTGSGNKYYADGALQPTLTLAEGSTYKFDQSDSSNNGHPLRFSTTNDGTHGSGSEYTTGVTTAGTPGSAGAFTQIVIAASAPTLYVYCTVHSGMGFQVNTSDKGGFTIPVGSLNSSLYNQAETWNSQVTGTSQTYDFGGGGKRGNNYMFDGNIKHSTAALGAAPGANIVWSGSIAFSTSFAIANENDGASSAINITHGAGNTVTNVRSQVPNTSNSQLNAGTVLLTTLTGITSPVTKIELVSSSSAANGITRVVADNKMLVDSSITLANVPSIASQVMASPESGFSIVTYTGVSGNQSIGHGLNAKPKFIIFKNRSNTSDWFAMFDTGAASYQHGYLNGTSKFYNATEQSVSNTTITLGNNNSMFGAVGDNYVTYCFAPVAGYSAMGSYTGNGSTDGPFVHTGFKIGWLMVKKTNSTGTPWQIQDATRSPFNDAKHVLMANYNWAEASANPNMDLLSNGFKPRRGSGYYNSSGDTFIYIAFASHPFASNGGLAR